MWSLGSTLFMLLFAGIPIGISLAGATAIGVLFDDFLTYSTLFEAFFSFLTKYTLVAIPLFIGKNNMPVGCQFVTKKTKDDLLLSISKRILKEFS